METNEFNPNIHIETHIWIIFDGDLPKVSTYAVIVFKSKNIIRLLNSSSPDNPKASFSHSSVEFRHSNHVLDIALKIYFKTGQPPDASLISKSAHSM